MPRKTKAEQAGRFAKGRKSKNQWPGATVWGSGRYAEIALDRWVARHDCDGTCEGPGSCGNYQEARRLHTMYAVRKGRRG